jgi:hypothetical protein
MRDRFEDKANELFCGVLECDHERTSEYIEGMNRFIEDNARRQIDILNRRERIARNRGHQEGNGQRARWWRQYGTIVAISATAVAFVPLLGPALALAPAVALGMHMMSREDAQAAVPEDG